MSEFKPQIGGVNLSMTVALPELPLDWHTSIGVMHMKDFRRGEVEGIGEALKDKIIQQWEILTEDTEARQARLEKAREAARAGMCEEDKMSKGIDAGTLAMIGAPVQTVTRQAGLTSDPGTIGHVDMVAAAE